MTGKNKEFTEFELVRFLGDDYLREKRALPVWEIEKRSDFDQTRVLELFDGPRLQRDMVDDLGDETFEPKPALLAEIIVGMREGLQYQESLLRVLLKKFERLDRIDEDESDRAPWRT